MSDHGLLSPLGLCGCLACCKARDLAAKAEREAIRAFKTFERKCEDDALDVKPMQTATEALTALRMAQHKTDYIHERPTPDFYADLGTFGRAALKQPAGRFTPLAVKEAMEAPYGRSPAADALKALQSICVKNNLDFEAIARDIASTMHIPAYMMKESTMTTKTPKPVKVKPVTLPVAILTPKLAELKNSLGYNERCRKEHQELANTYAKSKAGFAKQIREIESALKKISK